MFMEQCNPVLQYDCVSAFILAVAATLSQQKSNQIIVLNRLLWDCFYLFSVRKISLANTIVLNLF